jgi:transposase-like protein
MSSKKTRRHHTPDQKIAILRRHLIEKVPVSELCEEHDLQPSVFYSWQRQLFESGAQAFQESRKQATKREEQLAQEIERLEARLARKDEVIAAVTGEMVSLKKELGEP